MVTSLFVSMGIANKHISGWVTVSQSLRDDAILSAME